MSGWGKDRQQPSQEPDRDTIYYLKTSTPHVNDISISGPYYPLEAIIPQVRHHLSARSPTSVEAFDQMLSEWPGLQSFQHFKAPIAGGHMIIELAKEKNRNVAAALPGPVWYIARAEPASLGLPSPHSDREFVQLKALDVLETFTSVESANRRANELMAQTAREMGTRHVSLTQPGGAVAGAVLRGSQMIMFEVKGDTGHNATEPIPADHVE